MRAVLIAVKDLKVVLRDYKALALIIAMPIILIMILGAALSNMFGTGAGLKSITVAVAGEPGQEPADTFYSVIESEDLRELMQVYKAGSEEEARELVRESKVDAAIMIPRTIHGAFTVLGNPDNTLHSSVVKALVDTFVSQYSAVYNGSQAVYHVLSQQMIDMGISPDEADKLAGSMAESAILKLAEVTTQSASMFTRVDQSREEWISSLQYYAAGMTVMFSLFGGMLGTKSILEERDSNTVVRIFSTRVSKTEFIAGKAMGTLMLCLLQVFLLVVFSALAFRINWGDTWGVIIVSAALALASTGFSMVVAAVSKNQKMADGLSNLGIQVMSALGGCSFPLYFFPPFLHTISKFTLTRWGLQSYLLLMEGKTWVDIGRPVMILAGIGLAFLVIGLGTLKVEQR